MRFPYRRQMIHALKVLLTAGVFFRNIVVIGAESPNPMSSHEAIAVVKGVAVPFSVFGIIKRLEQIPGVEQVSFNLSQGLADIHVKPEARVTDDQIRQAIVDASYTPGDIRWIPSQESAGR